MLPGMRGWMILVEHRGGVGTWVVGWLVDTGHVWLDGGVPGWRGH